MIPELINIQDRLSSLNFPNLAYRMDMIMLYKIIHDLDGSPFDNFYIPQNPMAKGD